MNALDIRQVLDLLPHRYPFLLIDKVLDVVPGERLTAIKNVTINEPYFVGHFPHLPVMPGVLQIEAMAQAAGILYFKTLDMKSDENSVFYFVGIDGARFKRPVGPGDRLQLDVTVVRASRSIWKFHGEASVDGKVAAVADLMCTLRRISPEDKPDPAP